MVMASRGIKATIITALICPQRMPLSWRNHERTTGSVALVELLNTNSYQKGAWTLHMLRSMLGDTSFFRGIREYYRLHRHSSATSDDLCEVFERVSKKNLRWFFDQWLALIPLRRLREDATVMGACPI